MTPEQQTLFDDNLSVAYNLAYEWGSTRWYDRDDLLTAAMTGLWQAATRYSDDVQVPFSCYAYRRVRGAVCDAMRQFSWFDTRLKDWQGCHVTDINEDHMKGYSMPDTEIDTKEQVRLALNCLDKREMEMIRMHYFEHLDTTAIGRRLGISQSAMHQALRAIRGKLRRNITSSRGYWPELLKEIA